MAHPVWLAYGFAVVMVAISVYCIFRLALAKRLGRQTQNDVNISHVLMGLAMVGMLVPRWNKIPNGLWEICFAVIVLYFVARSVRFVVARGIRGIDDDHIHHISHYLIHAVMACAMLYMYWLGMPITTRSGPIVAMSGPPNGAGDPGLTLLLIAVLLGSAIWQLESIGEFAPQRSVARSTLVNAPVNATVMATGGGLNEASAGGAAVGGGGEDAGQRPWLAPRLEIACHIAMCITMAYVLVLMV